MGYHVEIVIAAAPGPQSEDGMPVFRLPKEYPSVLAAKSAAEAYISSHGYKPGQAFYHLYDDAGNLAVDSTTVIQP